mgnify:CR=1 FL=1
MTNPTDSYAAQEAIADADAYLSNAVLFSPTGYQTGFGTDRYKHASGLTPEEREAARAGAVVLFKAARKSHPTSPHGTFYRWAKPYGRVFKPRVATADMLRAAGLA